MEVQNNEKLLPCNPQKNCAEAPADSGAVLKSCPLLHRLCPWLIQGVGISWYHQAVMALRTSNGYSQSKRLFQTPCPNKVKQTNMPLCPKLVLEWDALMRHIPTTCLTPARWTKAGLHQSIITVTLEKTSFDYFVCLSVGWFSLP